MNMAPNKRNTKHIHPQARQVILNVINYFQSEKDCNGFFFNVHQVGERAAAATGYTEQSISRIRQEAHIPEVTAAKISASKSSYSAKVELDCSQLLAIKNIISSFYTNKKQAPTLKAILQNAKEELKIDFSQEFLRKVIIKKLGYKYKRSQSNKSFLIEKHEVRLSRAKYLYRLQQNTALGPDAKPVVYLDETWLQLIPVSPDNVTKESKMRQYIMMNGSGRMGFIPEAKLLSLTKLKTSENYKEMDDVTYPAWLNKYLIPYLPDNAIVVLGNAPVQSIEMNKPPGSTSKREDLEKWLQQHKVPFESNLLKIQLFELVKQNCPFKVYIIDEILKQNGHEVLRLPFNYDLNPIEYMCGLLIKRLANIDTEISESEIETLTNDAIDSLKNTDWLQELEYIKYLEKEYWRKEQQIEYEIEQLIISIGGTDSDSETEHEFASDSSIDCEDVGPSSPSSIEPVVNIVEYN